MRSNLEKLFARFGIVPGLLLIALSGLILHNSGVLYTTDRPGLVLGPYFWSAVAVGVFGKDLFTKDKKRGLFILGLMYCVISYGIYYKYISIN